MQIQKIMARCYHDIQKLHPEYYTKNYCGLAGFNKKYNIWKVSNKKKYTGLFRKEL